MSLITRGLGPTKSLITAGLGGSFLIKFLGSIISRTLTLTSVLAKDLGLGSLSERMTGLASSIDKNIYLSGEKSTSSNIGSESTRKF
jgi:hypothetical protein